MNSIQWKQWADVLEIRNGRNQKGVVNPQGKYPIIGSGGVMGYADDYLCPKNSVVIGRKGTINAPLFIEEDFWNVDTAFGLVSNTEKLDSKYLYYFCMTFNFLKLNKSTTLPSLTKSDLLKIQIPLPPLETQKRITRILDLADEHRQKTKALLEKYDELAQSIFLEMFGDPVTNPKGFQISSIGDQFFVKGGKRLPKGELYSEVRTAHPYLRVVDFERNGINISSIKYLTEQVAKRISRYTIKSTEVYISIAGSIGIAGYIPDGLDGANLTENAAKLIPKNKEIFSREFVSYYLNSPYCQNQIKSKTMAVGVPKLALFRIEEIPFIVPPKKNQEEFQEMIRSIQIQKANAEKCHENANNLFNSLLQRAFKGELN